MSDAIKRGVMLVGGLPIGFPIIAPCNWNR